MTTTVTAWTRTVHEIVHEFEVTGAPDLQDSERARRRVLRPRKVTLRQVPGTNLVRSACIEGRQVRLDGELAGSQMILAGMQSEPWGYRSTPPDWLNTLVAQQGLEWFTGPSRELSARSTGVVPA